MSSINHNGLSSTLFGKVRLALLALLYSRADESFYLRQLVRMTGLGHGAVQRELGNLAGAGIITKTRQGRMVYYRANRDCPVFDELQRLMGKTAGLADVLRKALAPLTQQIELAFVYGSQARFDAGTASDVDVLIVGNVDELALHRALAEAEEYLDRSVNSTLLSRQELEHRRKDKEGFLARVLSGEKIFIVGQPQDV